MQGLVIKSTGSWYTVLNKETNQAYACRIKGKFRIKGIQSTNPIAVGDLVLFDLEPNADTGIIETLLPRKNYIIRRSINLSKQVQIIASNLDQAFLIVTLASPRTSLGFIDRFLVTAEAFQVPTHIIFNKLDLFSDYGLDILNDYIRIYENLGYPCHTVSAIKGTHLSELKALLNNKITLLSGHSGVGKSSLINALVPNQHIKTGMVSESSDKGQHTTTFAEMHALDLESYLIDTPGIRELGITEIEKEELGRYFPEMRSRMNACKFHNCRHINEPKCAVLEALENNEIEASRYDSYLSIYHGNDSRNKL